MKRAVVWAMIGVICLGCVTGCGETEDVVVSESYIGESRSEELEDYQLFPTSDTNFVGDTMPYYEDGVFHIFYLADMRDNKRGYHPWSLYETSNFYEFEDKGVVIPYADSAEAQDIALGTGSVIKDQNGKYHAFYTGHNDTYEPREAIMHAISDDMMNWTKLPEDTFYAGDAYSSDDFRDPYVLYVEEEKQYWMLITTRTDAGGVIAKYTSKNLTEWTDAGVFFENDMGSDSNMECPSLIRYQGKWYLGFSDQWPDRMFHYRVSGSSNGPFEEMEQDVVDGNGFYAGRLESDGENLYVVGWNATKNEHLDSEEYNWGGNLVAHQLVQEEDGSLVPILNTSIKEKMANELPLQPTKMTETIQKEDNNYTFSGTDYEVAEFNNLSGSYLLEGTIRDFTESEKFGLSFNIGADEVGALNLVFDVKDNKIAFYNTEEIYSNDPQSEIDIDFASLDELNISVLISDGVVTMYVNNKCAMTARMYYATETTWGIFGMNSDVKFEDVRIYK